MNQNATATGPSAVRFFAYGNGDGSTTFTLPLLADYVVAGVGGSLGTTGQNGVGSKIGLAAQPVAVANLPSGFPSATIPFNIIGGTGPGIHTVAYAGSSPAMYGVFPVNTTVNFSSTGSGTALPVVQQTILMKKCIRFE
jgi:hypothetical protein